MMNFAIAYVSAPTLAIYLCSVPRVMLGSVLDVLLGFLEVAVRMRGPCILFFINFFLQAKMAACLI